MDAGYYQKYEPIFGSWKIKKKLGEGNFGAVFEIEREDFGTTYHSALKAITIPKSQADLESIMDDGLDATSAESYLEQFVEKIVGEFVLMSKLKGNSNIVSYEDHQVIKHKDGIGWDILIRMELLTPMMSYMKANAITKRDVIKLGIDMCRALELCQKYNIIHRDIKPENIFISDNGDFKLGDFGIAKEVEKTQSGLTKTGTQTYMAPEVYKGQPYGSGVDLYSLGVVLYRLLNHNRAPFMPQYPEPISYSDRERAMIMRMGGHKFPNPSGVEAGCRLAEIAMKACSFNEKDRYSSPTQMREDLEAILYTEGEGVLMFPKGDNLEIKSVEYVSNSKASNKTQKLSDEATEIMDNDATEIMDDGSTEVMEDVRNRFNTSSKTKSSKKKSLKFIIPAAIVALLIVSGVAFKMLSTNKNVPSYAVSDASTLNNPIEFEIKELVENDYNIIAKRLETLGVRYYADKERNIFAVSKNDLGSTNQEILATVHMIAGVGEIEFNNINVNSEFGISSKDIKNIDIISKDNKNILSIEVNDDKKDKLTKLSEEILSSENKEMALFVDGNIRLCQPISQKMEEGKITITNENSGTSILSSIFGTTVSAEEISLSTNYMKLIMSFAKDGKLSKQYEIIIDEKYGLTIQEQEPEVDPEPDVVEENAADTSNDDGKPVTTNQETSNTKTQGKKPSTQTQQKPASQSKQEKPAQQPQQPQQQPQKQPQQQAPAKQEQNQPSTNNTYTEDVPEIFDPTFN